MALVEFYRVESYQEERIRRAIRRILESNRDLFSRRDRVLVKPNLLSPTAPERAVVTHPVVVKVLVEELLELGVEVKVGDSPALNSARKVAKACGLLPWLKELSVELVEFETPVEVKSPGVVKRLELSREALEFDRVINVAKMKTHSQMVLTLAIKNMFGTVPGKIKGEWHVKASRYIDFARMLVSVYLASPPVLNIVDAIVAMEGNGPQNGRPRPVGYIIASRDGFALDRAVAEMVGAAPYLYVLKAADELGIESKFEVGGEIGKLPSVRPFLLPDSTPVAPEPIRRLVRTGLPRPAVIGRKCEGGGVCVEACPTGAMYMRAGRAEVNYDKCISCFVCQEVCPFDAIKIKTGWLGTIFRKFF